VAGRAQNGNGSAAESNSSEAQSLVRSNLGLNLAKRTNKTRRSKRPSQKSPSFQVFAVQPESRAESADLGPPLCIPPPEMKAEQAAQSRSE